VYWPTDYNLTLTSAKKEPPPRALLLPKHTFIATWATWAENCRSSYRAIIQPSSRNRVYKILSNKNLIFKI